MKMLVSNTFYLQLYILEAKSELQCASRDKITTRGSSDFLKIVNYEEEYHQNHHVGLISFRIIVACKQLPWTE